MEQKLLVADDNADNRQLVVAICKRLRLTDFEILEAADGIEALEIILREKPCLILLDIMMPGLSGYEVCERVRKDPTLAATYIIMLTAKDLYADRMKGKEVGANDYLVKPYDITVLRELISKALKLTCEFSPAPKVSLPAA
jgi:CheY-like chemotaxis protein